MIERKLDYKTNSSLINFQSICTHVKIYHQTIGNVYILMYRYTHAGNCSTQIIIIILHKFVNARQHDCG